MSGPEPLLLPPSLRPGDTIGLFSPAGPIRDHYRAEAGIRLLHELGFRVKIAKTGHSAPEYLAGSDQYRVRTLHGLWADEEVRVLMAMRGGFGCLRIADQLDMDFFRNHPKFVIGFSDITVLHAALYTKAGLVTVHGPVVSSLAATDRHDIRRLFSLLSGAIDSYTWTGEIEILRNGIHRGPLVGGNLASLISLLGTPWEIPWKDCIVILEDTAEPMYRIDRMLTQLACSGRLDAAGGLILGTFDHPSGDPLESMRLQEQAWNRVLELTAGSNQPVWGNAPVGHQQRNIALPLGMEATMHSADGSLHLHRQTVCFTRR